MDDDAKEVVVIEDDAVREDLYQKVSAQSHPIQPNIAIDDDLKMTLTIQTSKASIPGAFCDNKGDAGHRKLSQEQTVNYTRLKQAQKARGYVDRESQRPEATSVDEELAIDTFNENMNSFMHVTNMSTAKEDQQIAKKKYTRRRMLLCGGVTLLLLVGSCVGVVVGMRTGMDIQNDETPSTLPTVNTTEKCYFGSIHEQSARYAGLQSKLLSEAPDLADAIQSVGSRARFALCWLADSDGFQINVTQNVLERFALAMLYYNFVGRENSTETKQNALSDAGWMGEQSVCFWKGVECESTDKQVVKGLNLQKMRLASSIPTELFLLTNLVEFDLSENDLTGKIPVEIGVLTHLKTLRLDYNRLSGQAPSEIFGLPKLEVVDMRLDFLSGTIPERLTSSTSLVNLVMTGILTGTIPELSKLSNLNILQLDKMMGVVGTVPDFSSSTDLEVLSLLFTTLTGTLPSFIWSFSNLTTLRLQGSLLIGTIPTEIGYLSRLKSLQIPDSFTGTIPSEIGLLSNLEILRLPNGMDGTLPAEVCLFSNLTKTEVTSAQCACCSQYW